MRTVGWRGIGYAVGLAVSLLLLNPWGTSSVAQPKPDLVVTSLGDPTPASALPGGSFSIPIVTVANQGAGNADPKPATGTKPALTQIVTKFYLLNGSIRKNLSGVQIIDLPLLAGESVSATDLTLGAFSDTAPGVYSLQACADGGGDITEGPTGSVAENNNCITAVGMVNILPAPDLQITTLSTVPSSTKSAGQGQPITVKDTVMNIGGIDSGPTTTRYFLVSTVTGLKTDLKLPNPQNPVVVPKATGVPEQQAVTIPPEAAPGDYHLQACADGAKVQAELSETNNCLQLADIFTVIAMPDLIVTSVAVDTVTVNPSTKLKPLQNSFVVTVVVKNQGSAPTLDKSALKFSLLDSATPPHEKNLDLPKSSSAIATIPINLLPGTSVTLPQTVILFSDTARGTYKVQTCADSAKGIPESVDNNNCASTAVAAVTVEAADPVPPCHCDLVVTAVPNPPAAIVPGSNPVVTRTPGHALPGDILKLTATVENKGPGDAGASTVSFFLVDTANKQKNLKVPNGPGLAIKPLAAPPAPGSPGGSDTPAPADFIVFTDTLIGTYTLRACADGPKLLPEANEKNNCLDSLNPTTGLPNTITIDPTPNLVVSSLSDPPNSLPAGQSFTVKTTKVKNTGVAGTLVASRTKYFLVSDLDGTRKDLQGSLTVPPLDPAKEFTDHTMLVTIQFNTAKGAYHFQGCADAGKDVTESNENDNCLTAGPITVLGLPDLVVTKVTIQNLQTTVTRGGTFSINASVSNVGETDIPGTPAPTLKYILADPVTNAQVYDLNSPQTFATPGGLRSGSNTTVPKTITVPIDAPLGTFNVRVCADAIDVVVEGSEGNNCLSSSAITVTVP